MAKTTQKDIVRGGGIIIVPLFYFQKHFTINRYNMFYNFYSLLFLGDVPPMRKC